MLALAVIALTQFAPTVADAPNREPRFAVSGHTVALAYGSGNGIYVATSLNDGRTFGKPVEVGTAPVVPLSRHRGPRIVFSKNTMVLTAVVGEKEATGTHAHGLPADGDLLAWRSTDNGKTWSKPVRVNDVPAAPREGLHTLVAKPNGELFAAWLDLRNTGTRLYGSVSKDGGVTWQENVKLYESPEGTICQCCHPTASVAGDGALEVMWRNALDGARDFYLLRSMDGRTFGKAQKLGEGTWKINACPMDGGDLTHVAGKTVSVWRRMDEIYIAEPGKAEVKIGPGHDVTAASTGNSLWLLYVKEGKAMLWNEGSTQQIGEDVTFPALAALSNGRLIAAWEKGGAIVVAGVDQATGGRPSDKP